MLGVLGISKCKILALFAFISIWRTSSTSSYQYIPLHTVGHLFFQTFLLDYAFKMDETICASYAHDKNHISNNAEMIQKNCPIVHESWKHTAINVSFCKQKGKQLKSVSGIEIDNNGAEKHYTKRRLYLVLINS